MEDSVYSVTPHSLHPRSWYTSYRQTSVFSLVVVCPVASGDPRQGQRTQHEVAPTMCTVEAVWLDQSIYSIDNTKDQESFVLCCKYYEYVESTRSEDISSPKYLNVLTVSRTVPLRVMGVVGSTGDLI